jgi:hypothetical protein
LLPFGPELSFRLSKNLNIRIYNITVLPVVLYGCETWSLVLEEEHKRRVFENRVSRRISEPRRCEMTGGWRKLHNEELCNLYSSPSLIRIIMCRRIRLVGHVARIALKRYLCRLLLGKKPRHGMRLELFMAVTDE